MPIVVTVDRFEGDLAVLVVEPEGAVVNVPRSDLPEGAGEGDVIRLEGVVDRDATEKRCSEARERIKRLEKRDGSN
jgi:hypothetical protein